LSLRPPAYTNLHFEVRKIVVVHRSDCSYTVLDLSAVIVSMNLGFLTAAIQDMDGFKWFESKMNNKKHLQVNFSKILSDKVYY
jgi:hypothetical protein